MKSGLSTYQTLKAAWLLLWTCLLPAAVSAQGGITVYSDTVSVLEDAASDSTAYAPMPPSHYTFPLQDFFMSDTVTDLLGGMLGLTGIVLVIFAIAIFLIPLVLIGLVIYWIYRSNRNKKQKIEREAYNPESQAVDEEVRNRLLQQSAIKYACWGIGIIVIGWLLDAGVLLHVVGVVLLCFALNDWLTTLVGKKKK